MQQVLMSDLLKRVRRRVCGLGLYSTPRSYATLAWLEKGEAFDLCRRDGGSLVRGRFLLPDVAGGMIKYLGEIYDVCQTTIISVRLVAQHACRVVGRDCARLGRGGRGVRGVEMLGFCSAEPKNDHLLRLASDRLAAFVGVKACGHGRRKMQLIGKYTLIADVFSA